MFIQKIVLMVLALLSFNVFSQVSIEKIEQHGENFFQFSSSISATWLNGVSPIPDLTSETLDLFSHWNVNTRAPEIPSRLELEKNFSNQENPHVAVFSYEMSKKEEFLKEFYKSVYNKTAFHMYNQVASQGRFLSCWDKSNPACTKLKNRAYGFFTLFASSLDKIPEQEAEILQAIKMSFILLQGAGLHPAEELAAHAIYFEYTKDYHSLWSIGFRMNEEKHLFEDYHQGLLKTKAGLSADMLQTLSLSHFTLSKGILQTATSKDLHMTNSAVKRIESLKYKLNEIISSHEWQDLTVVNFYRDLGMLDKHYEEQANYIALDQLRQFRGEIRSHSEQLTNSIVERMFLKSWGFFTNYGTSISMATIILVSLFMITLFILAIDVWKHRRSPLLILENFFKIITLRGTGDNQLSLPKFFTLFLELLFFLYIPAYMSFLVTFFLRYH